MNLYSCRDDIVLANIERGMIMSLRVGPTHSKHKDVIMQIWRKCKLVTSGNTVYINLSLIRRIYEDRLGFVICFSDDDNIIVEGTTFESLIG